MLILKSVNDKIELVTASNGDIEVHVSYIDYDASQPVNDRFSPNRTNTASITTAATTPILASPGSGVARNAKLISIKNNHASVSNSVIMQHTDGTNVENMTPGVLNLAPGELAQWIDNVGWKYWDAAGNEKVVLAAGNLITIAELATESNSTTTPTEVAGLTRALGVGNYMFIYAIAYQAAATTTGVRFDVNFTGTVTRFVWWQRWVDVSATAATAAADQDEILSTGAVMGAFASRAKGTAGRGTTLSVDTANADMLMIIEGVMTVTVAGEIELWHGSEVAAASSVMPGSMLVILKAVN